MAPATTLEEVLGFEFLALEEASARGHVDVRDELRQHLGVVHGGVLSALAESLASHATYRVVNADGRTSLGMSNLTSFLRPISSGRIHAAAERVHRGRTTWVWDVRISDDDGRLCAVSRVTVAVREAG